MHQVELGTWIATLAIAGLTVVGGCANRKSITPVVMRHPADVPMTIAVAPAWNFSGSAGLDVSRAADLMASELTYAEGVSVVPVSRVLGVLSAQGVDRVQSPDHAMELAELLGADLVLVFAVTEYDPYDPPSIGISAQLYGTRPRPRGGALDPVALSRQVALGPARPVPVSRGLIASCQRVFDASHDAVVADIKRFAAKRGGDDSPWGWRKYMVSQQHYLRFCCYAAAEALLTDLARGGPPPAGDTP
jgi:hypothetical protein